MNHEQVTQINKDQYQDEMLHKMETYDRVKATLELCKTMIQALDASTDREIHSKKMLVSYLDLSQNYAMLAAVDVDLERRGLGK